MERESDSPCRSHTYPERGRRSPRRKSGWEPELRDGRRLRWEMPVEESQAAMEARQNCWVMRRGWSLTIAALCPLTSMGSWAIEKLAHQEPEAWNHRVGPHPGAPLSAWCVDLQSRTPASGSPLCAWRGEQRGTPGKGVLEMPGWVELWRKSSQRVLLIASCQRLKKGL